MKKTLAFLHNKMNNMSLEARKIAMVKQILNIDNEIIIKELETKIIQLLPEDKPDIEDNEVLINQNKRAKLKVLPIPPPIKLRKKVSLDEIVKEQRITPITYEEIQALSIEMEWKHSLKELLDAIN